MDNYDPNCDPHYTPSYSDRAEVFRRRGEAFNSSIYDRLWTLEEKLEKEFNRIDNRLSEGLRYNYSIDNNISRIVGFGETLFYGYAGYFIYLLVKKYLF